MESIHLHGHGPNRFGVIPTIDRLKANTDYTGKGITVAFLDSGFYPHPDLSEPRNRIVAYEDLTGEHLTLQPDEPIQPWHWHGTQTSVVAAGNGYLSDGVYRGLASESQLVLVKVSESGKITEENIARGIRWVIKNKDRFGIRVLNISLGADQDVPCSLSVIDQAAEEAIRQGIVVVAAAGNSDGSHSIPPANSPSVITVGGYTDNNRSDQSSIDLYHSNYGATADGTVKPEVIAPAMWVAAPILPGSNEYGVALALAQLGMAPDYQLPKLFRTVGYKAGISLVQTDLAALRLEVENALRRHRVVSTHYQHVDGTSFAAPIVTSVVAQMLEANPRLTPAAVKDILISTADRIASAPALRQGYGIIDARHAVELARSEQHVIASVGCGAPRIQNGKLRFWYHDDAAQSVVVVGSFNQWNPNGPSFVKNDDGIWLVELEAPGPGCYEYKFLLDGQRWIEDPSNGLKVPDNYGGLNSVLVIQ